MTTSELLMAIFTGVIAVTGIIGAFVFNGQMVVMKGQLAEMKSTGSQTQALIDANNKSANAAEQSAKSAAAANRLLTLTQRPYVQILNVELTSPLKRELTGDFTFSIQAVFKNNGATPASKTFPSFQAFLFRIAPWEEMKLYSDGLRNVPVRAPADSIAPKDDQIFKATLTVTPDAGDAGTRIGLYVGAGYYFDLDAPRYITAATFILRKKSLIEGQDQNRFTLAPGEETNDAVLQSANIKSAD